MKHVSILTLLKVLPFEAGKLTSALGKARGHSILRTYGMLGQVALLTKVCKMLVSD